MAKVAPASVSKLPSKIGKSKTSDPLDNVTRAEFNSYKTDLFKRIDVISATLVSLLEFQKDAVNAAYERRVEGDAQREQTKTSMFGKVGKLAKSAAPAIAVGAGALAAIVAPIVITFISDLFDSAKKMFGFGDSDSAEKIDVDMKEVLGETKSLMDDAEDIKNSVDELNPLSSADNKPQTPSPSPQPAPSAQTNVAEPSGRNPNNSGASTPTQTAASTTPAPAASPVKSGSSLSTPTPSATGGSNRDMIVGEMENAGIADKTAQGNILAQVQAESNFQPRSESMNYSPERLLQVFPNKVGNIDNARKIVSQGQEAIGNLVYGGRMGNAPDEGFKYRGRGYIQLTGKDNYAAASKAIGVDLVSNPDLANDPKVAAKIVPWYYKNYKRLNDSQLADIGSVNKATGFVRTAGESEKRAALAASQISQLSNAPKNQVASIDASTTTVNSTRSQDKTQPAVIAQSARNPDPTIAVHDELSKRATT